MAERKNGFSLVEMSIVVLIIGLLVGGIVSAKVLIRQAELRAVTQEYDRYVKSVKEFMDKYQQLPGDMTNAETLWGLDDDGVGGCETDTIATVSTGTLTCNGDGDGKIGNCADDFGISSGTCSDTGEIWRAWQQMAIAGFVEGRYSGRRGVARATTATLGLNAPASRLKPGGWTLLYYLNVSVADPAWLDNDHYGHVLLFGGVSGVSSKFTTEPILPVEDARILDMKMDDGSPVAGILRAWDDVWLNPGTQECVDDTDYAAIDASLTEREQMCSLIFIPGF